MVTLRKKIKGTFDLQPYEIDPSLPAMKILKNLPEKFPAEVIDDHLYVHEPASLYHSIVNYDLSVELGNYVKSRNLGRIFVEPAGVWFNQRKTVVMPDIFFVSNEKSHLLKSKGLCGSPDLVIEVLSRSTRKYNFTMKKDIYEKYGVKEYWLIDPETKNATGFLLKKGTYGAPLIMRSKIYVRIFDKEFSF